MRSGVPSAFGDDALKPIFAVKLELETETLRFWNGLGDVIVDGETYLGAGHVVQISPVEESGDIAARGMTVTLSGLPSEVLSVVLSANYQNRPVTVHVGTISEARVTDTIIAFRGRMDTMNIEESGETCNVQITCENRLIDLERPRIRRYTDEDQKGLYPDDKGFEFVASLQEKSIDWGRSND